MARTKIGNFKQVAINMDISHIKFLEFNRINRARFVRQAVRAFMKGKFKYDAVDQS